MIEVVDLVKNYGKMRAVDGLSFKLSGESIFGFVGPNGAGKTTTMRIMAGLLSASSGSVVIDGVDIIKKPRSLREKIGYMPDFFGVYDNLKVDEYMDFYAGAYYIPYKDRPEIINNLLELVDLTEKRDSYVDALSRGMKQRLCLARAMIHDPEVLILDEPASGLDPRARIEMKEVLKLLKTMGKSIIISSHILSDLAEMCDVVGIVNNGNMVTYGSMTEIMRRIARKKVIILRYLGESSEVVRFLQELPSVSGVDERVAEIEFQFDGDDGQLAWILAEMIKRHIPVIEFKEKEGNLEDIFMKLTFEGKNEVGQ